MTEIQEASDGNEVITQSKLHKPDVLSLDYYMPNMSGYDAAHILLKEDRNLRIVLLTMYDTKPIVMNFLKIGGKGFIWKGGSPDHIAEGVRVVGNGDYYFSSVNDKAIVEWMENGINQKSHRL